MDPGVFEKCLKLLVRWRWIMISQNGKYALCCPEVLKTAADALQFPALPDRAIIENVPGDHDQLRVQSIDFIHHVCNMPGSHK